MENSYLQFFTLLPWDSMDMDNRILEGGVVIPLIITPIQLF